MDERPLRGNVEKEALAFLKDANVDFERGDHDLVLFHVEQFLQLYLKYFLYRRLGDFPKTHPLLRLIRDVTRVYGSKELERFYGENLEALYLLEEAYITSRYVPREYGKEIAERILKFAEKALEVLKCLETAS